MPIYALRHLYGAPRSEASSLIRPGCQGCGIGSGGGRGGGGGPEAEWTEAGGAEAEEEAEYQSLAISATLKDGSTIGPYMVDTHRVDLNNVPDAMRRGLRSALKAILRKLEKDPQSP